MLSKTATVTSAWLPRSLWLLPFLLLLPFAYGARAATYYVAVNGDDLRTPTQATNPTTSWKTIHHAAQVAVAGDTVLIQPGTYDESVTVKNFGTARAPITFQSVKWHGALLTNTHAISLLQPTGKKKRWYSGFYITLRGLVFGTVPRRLDRLPDSVSIYAAEGWRFEDCLFQSNYGLQFFGDVNNVDNGTILHCVFEDCYCNSFSASTDGHALPGGGRYRVNNFTIKNTIIRRSNRSNYDPNGFCGAGKVLWSSNTVLDGLISYDNQGAGTHFDTGCTNFVVRNCTFFGNHAGICWGIDGKGATYYSNSEFAGSGLWTEANPSGTIKNNVFYSNLGDGIGDLNSGRDGILISDNILVDNVLEFNGALVPKLNGDERFLGPATVTHNLFKFSENPAWNTSYGTFTSPPMTMGIYFDYNTYDPAPDYKGVWIAWNGTDAAGLEQMQRRLYAEPHGIQKSVPFRGTLIKTYRYPTSKENARFPDASLNYPSVRQVHDDETSSIDVAVGSNGVGAIVTIPVFGHTPFLGTGPYTCEVYDLRGRWMTLHLTTAKAITDLDAAVTPYAVITATNITVRLMSTNPYDMQARYPATPPSGGSLAGSVVPTAGRYNLTALGTSDWAYWNGTFHHKANGGNRISDLTQIGGGTFSTMSEQEDIERAVKPGINGTWAISWTDGTPTAHSADNTDYVWCGNAVNTGWTFTVPADTNTKVLNVLCGGNGAQVTIQASLSDGSAPDYSDTRTAPGAAENGDRFSYADYAARMRLLRALVFTNRYRFTYKAASAGQRLTITVRKTGDGGAADLIAAWLTGG